MIEAYVDGLPGPIAEDRRRGYQAALRRHGLENRALVIPGGHSEEAGTRAVAALMSTHPRPTAVIAFNDRVAVGLLDGLLRGRARDKVSPGSRVALIDSLWKVARHLQFETSLVGRENPHFGHPVVLFDRDRSS